MTLVDRGDGDCALSAQDMRFWGLVADVMLRFQAFILFKSTVISGQIMGKEYPTFCCDWFVPRDHTYYYEIVDYLKQELKRDIESDHWRISISPFGGLEPHLPAADLDCLVKEFVQQFKMKLGKRKNIEDKENPQAPP